MPQSFYTKRGDTGIPLEVILKDARGAIDLTGWTVKMIMTPHGKNTPRVIDEAEVAVAPDQTTNKGKISYAWEPEDVEVVGVFDVEFIGTTPTEEQITFPRRQGDEKFLRVFVIESKAE